MKWPSFWVGVIRRCSERSVLIFWIVTSCGFRDAYQCFGGTDYLHLQGWRWRKYVPLKHWYPHASPRGVTNQKFNASVTFIKSLPTLKKFWKNDAVSNSTERLPLFKEEDRNNLRTKQRFTNCILPTTPFLATCSLSLSFFAFVLFSVSLRISISLLLWFSSILLHSLSFKCNYLSLSILFLRKPCTSFRQKECKSDATCYVKESCLNADLRNVWIKGPRISWRREHLGKLINSARSNHLRTFRGVVIHVQKTTVARNLGWGHSGLWDSFSCANVISGRETQWGVWVFEK